MLICSTNYDKSLKILPLQTCTWDYFFLILSLIGLKNDRTVLRPITRQYSWGLGVIHNYCHFLIGRAWELSRHSRLLNVNFFQCFFDAYNISLSHLKNQHCFNVNLILKHKHWKNYYKFQCFFNLEITRTEGVQISTATEVNTWKQKHSNFYFKNIFRMMFYTVNWRKTFNKNHQRIINPCRRSSLGINLFIPVW